MSRILSISAKCSDCCSAHLMDGVSRQESQGYVPFGVGVGGGDYIRLSIDLDTGMIVDWKTPNEEALDEAFPIIDESE